MLLADTQNRFFQQKYSTSSKNLLHIGTDEHGQKIAEAAKKAGQSPKNLVDQLNLDFKNLATKYNISYNDFIRTTDSRHVSNVQKIWTQLHSNGDISLENYAGWYCISDENFVQERDTEVIDGNRVLKENHKSEVKWLSEENYVFGLEKYLTDPIFVKFLGENVSPKVASKLAFSHYEQLLATDMKLSVSRPMSRLDWAIPVPHDASQGIYVWLDALSNYLRLRCEASFDKATFWSYRNLEWFPNLPFSTHGS